MHRSSTAHFITTIIIAPPAPHKNMNVKPKYGDKARLLMTDVNSLVYEIETDDFYVDCKGDNESRFDISEYRLDHPAALAPELGGVGFK
jgi:hypothetical protein